jgi:hypothetical protein
MNIWSKWNFDILIVEMEISMTTYKRVEQYLLKLDIYPSYNPSFPP